MPKTVLISGASIAGPALAYWLHRYGFDVTVVERAPALRPGGQAIDFKGRTHLTVLERMGILDEIEERQTGTTDTVFVDANGKRLAVMAGDFAGGDVEILRGDLADIMYQRTAERCEYLFGDSISGLTDTADGVYVEFERGPARSFDLVFGADGIHSRVRKLAFGPERTLVKYLGHYYCVAGASPWSKDATGPRERVIAHGHNTPGKLAISGGPKAQQLYMFASSELDYCRDDTAAQRRIVEEVYAGVKWDVPRMLNEMADFDDFYLDSISQVRMNGAYTKGRVALVGRLGVRKHVGRLRDRARRGRRVRHRGRTRHRRRRSPGGLRPLRRDNEALRQDRGHQQCRPLPGPEDRARHQAAQLVPALLDVHIDGEVRGQRGQRHRPAGLPGACRSVGGQLNRLLHSSWC
jgi:2-polyprenyl-6-methoxyphenol hydroxylase-like FAD-dependent oxidoreductase